MREDLQLEDLSLPRAKKPPSRFCGIAEAFHARSVKQHFRIEYLKMVDVATEQLRDRIIGCPGLKQYCELDVAVWNCE